MKIEYKEIIQQWDLHRSTRIELYINNELVGEYFISDRQKKKPFFFLHGLFVYKQHRKNGYGNLLLEHALLKAKRRRDKKVFIQIYRRHKFIKDWYIKNGFVLLDTDDMSIYPWMHYSL